MTELSQLTHADYAIKFCGKVRRLILSNKQLDAATRSMYIMNKPQNYPIRTYMLCANFVIKSNHLIIKMAIFSIRPPTIVGAERLVFLGLPSGRPRVVT